MVSVKSIKLNWFNDFAFLLLSYLKDQQSITSESESLQSSYLYKISFTVTCQSSDKPEPKPADHLQIINLHK